MLIRLLPKGTRVRVVRDGPHEVNFIATVRSTYEMGIVVGDQPWNRSDWYIWTELESV
jgi:hypothetical protein